MRKKLLFLALAIGIIIALCGCGKSDDAPAVKTAAPPRDAVLTIKVLDIGQGDSMLIFSGKDTVLIDTGDFNKKKQIVSLLKRENVKDIDIAFATHPHSDHIGCMTEIMKHFNVKKIVDSGQTHTPRFFREYLETVKKKNIPFEIVQRGNIYELDGGTKLEVIWPRQPFLKGTKGDLNNNSIVMRLTNGDFSMLLTADIQREAEEHLLKEAKSKLKCNVIKVPHHSSNGSSSWNFIKALHAKDAIISCSSDNDYGYPKEKVIKRYKDNDMNIYVTAFDGTITIKTDGKNYTVEKEKK